MFPIWWPGNLRRPGAAGSTGSTATGVGDMIHIYLDPVLWRWGPFTVTWHGVWLAAGVVLLRQVLLSGGQKVISRRHLDELAVWMLVLGLAGARLMYVVERWELYAAQPARILAFYEGGMWIQGAFLGGTIAVIGYARWRKLSFWHLADAIAIGIPAAELVGRIGCTIQGDVWGVPTNGTWGLVYHHPGTDIPSELLGVPTFPVPTLLQVWSASLLVLLLILRKRHPAPGTVFLACMIAYAAGRFVVNVWEHGQPFVLGLKGPQVVSLATIAICTPLLCLHRRRS